MFKMSTLTEFLGWSSVINICLLTMASLAVMLMRDSITKIHGKIFGLDNTDISRTYFQYIAKYKIAIVVFNPAPYVSLKIMG